MPARNDDVILGLTCKYICDGNDWVLVEGTAPEGYYCPEVLGGCLEPDETVEVEPRPIEPIPDPTPSPGVVSVSSQQTLVVNVGEYQFHRATETLYFSNGIAEKGFRFLSKIPMNELREKFPAIATEVELLKNAKSLSRFTVLVPAIPIDNRLKPSA